MNKITRRGFIEGVGATTLLPAVAYAAQPVELRQSIAGDDVDVLIDHFRVWTIKPKEISPTAIATVDLTARRVKISGATLPGGQAFSLTFDFPQVLNYRGVAATWRLGRQSFPGPAVLLPGLKKPPVISDRLRSCVISGHALTDLVRSIGGMAITAPNGAALTLDPEFGIALNAASGGSFTVLNGKLRSSRLVLSRLPAETLASFEIDARPVTLALGRYEAASAALISRDNITASITTPKGKPKTLRLSSRFDLRLCNGNADIASFACNSLEIVHEKKERRWSIKPETSGSRLTLPNVAFNVAPTSRPIELTEDGNGALNALYAEVEVQNCSVAVEGAERTRFDLCNQTLALTLPKTPSEAAPSYCWLGKPVPTVKLSLQNAALRLWRGRDLFNLTFRFHDFTLCVGESVTLETRPSALLIAEFPPQHIMERSFLRQNIVLPDVGTIKPAHLRQIQHGNTTVRTAVSKRKIEAEDKEIKDKLLPHPFAKFAEKWKSEHGEEFGDWIGPSGMFSIKERRAARKLAVKLRNEKLADLRKRVDGTLSDTDFGDVIDVLGLPAFPLSNAEAKIIVKRQPAGTKPEDILPELFRRAAQRSEDFESIQKTTVEPPGPLLLFRNWPFSTSDWNEIFTPDATDQNPKPTPPRQHFSQNWQAALRDLLDEQIKESSDTAPYHSDPAIYPEGFRRPVEAWIAEPSRLSFEIGEAKCIALTVDALTDWAKFDLRVIQRAKKLVKGDTKGQRENLEAQQVLESAPAEILARQHIPSGNSADGRKAAIAKTFHSPGKHDTALEITTGLILSPAQDAYWTTPRTTLTPEQEAKWGQRGTREVWQARLVERTAVPTLRAIWSRDMTDGEPFKVLPEKRRVGSLELRTALSPRDQAELVALTSLYGLPVIPSQDQARSSQIRMPLGYEINTKDGVKAALYMPVALTARRLTMSTTGAMLDLDTSFPAVTAIRDNGKPLFESYSLQRWRSLISDGTDIITTVVRRGYLFPLGHKASLIKVTEPRIRPINPEMPSQGYSIEQATRIFIEVTRARHLYPAVGQTNDGRSSQPREITLTTLRTPDLIDPSSDRPIGQPGDTKAALENPLQAGRYGAIRGWVDRGTGNELVPGPMSGKVFWPRTEVGPKGNVSFRMRIDGNTAPVSMPLIFVDHTAASDDQTIKALSTRYYNTGTDSKGTEKRPEWNKVQHNGASRRYADEEQQGQCTFETDWQIIHAVGGENGYSVSNETVAAEQPPFYPRMHKAQIRLQQVQGLTGSAAPVLQVEYMPAYEERGFLAQGTDSERPIDADTYLRVLNDTLPELEMGNNGDRGGTVARKAMTIGGLNRRYGLTGPIAAPAIPAPVPSTKTTIVAGADLRVPPALPPSVSEQNFAGDHFGDDAKLLGIIKLKDFITLLKGSDLQTAIPQLQEITSFTGDKLAEIVGTLKPHIEALETGIKDNAGELLFPDFYAALISLRKELNEIENKQGQGQIERATRIWTSGQRVVRELNIIAQTPIGDVAERLRGYLIQQHATLIAELRRGYSLSETDPAIKDLVNRAVKSAKNLIFVVDAPANAAAALADRISKAIIESQFWLKPDPWQELLNAAAAVLPKDMRAEDIVLQGPLYSVIQKVMARAAEQIDFNAIPAATMWAQNAIADVASFIGRLQALRDIKSLCDPVIGALKDLFEAVAPDIYNDGWIFSAGGQKAVDSIFTVRDKVEKYHTDLAKAPEPSSPTIGDIHDFLGKWKDKLDASGKNLQSALNATTATFNALKKAIDNLGTSCADLSDDTARLLTAFLAARQRLVALWVDVMNLPEINFEVPNNTAEQVVKLWSEIVALAVDTSSKAAQGMARATILNALKDGKPQLDEGLSKLGDLMKSLPQLREAINPINKELAKIPEEIEKTIGRLAKTYDDHRKNVLSAADLNKQLKETHRALVEFHQTIRTIERRLFDETLLVTMTTAIGKVDIEFDAGPINAKIMEFYDSIISIRNAAYAKLYKNLPHNDKFPLLSELFGKPNEADACDENWLQFLLYLPATAGSTTCTISADGNSQDGLTKERDDLKAGTVEALQEVLRRWLEKDPAKQSAPQRIAKHVEHFAKYGVRANIVQLFNVDALANTIKDELAKALPTTRTLKSNLTLPLTSKTVGGFASFRVQNGATLSLDTKTTIDLLSSSPPEVNLAGTVPPFELDILSIINFNFRDGVKYLKSAEHKSGKIDAPLTAEDIKFGDKLSFLADLSKAFSFGSGQNGKDGPYTILHIAKPAIEAGYRISIPIITLGVTFTNIQFAGAVVLPFSKESARLRAALGSLDAPFMISAGIYGGSGFMAIEASPRGIEAFEASFEFGGIASIGYGPLQGTGYVTTGAYVRKDNLGCSFAALFSAGFTAHIACFGISSAFTLRLQKQAGDASVRGKARLVYAFSIGPQKFRYGVDVARLMQKGFGGGNKQAADLSLPDRRIQVAAIGGFTPDCFPLEQAARLTVKSVGPSDMWSDFNAQFDPDFKPSFE